MERKPYQFATAEQTQVIIGLHRLQTKNSKILSTLNMQNTEDNQQWLKSQIAKLIRQGILTRKFLTRKEIFNLSKTQANSEKQIIKREIKPSEKVNAPVNEDAEKDLSKKQIIKTEIEHSFPTIVDKKVEAPASEDTATDPSASGCRTGWRRYGFVMEIATRKRFEKYAKDNGYEYGSLCTAILKHFLNKPFKIDIE